MYAHRLAREPVVVVRYHSAASESIDWVWALVVEVPTVQHYADAVPRVGRVRPFAWAGGPAPSVRQAVAALLDQGRTPA